MQSEPAYRQHRRAYLKPLLWALMVPAAVVLVKPALLDIWFEATVFIIILGPFVIAARIVYAWVNGAGLIRTALHCIRPLPAELVLNSDATVKAFPWVTVYLILLNTVIFFAIPEKPALRWVFPPVGDYSLLHMLGSTFTSAFLHADAGHLTGNMLFLWAFGSVLEPRVGGRRYLAAYFVCTLASVTLFAALMNIQATSPASSLDIGKTHTLGASGAISGVLGLFAVRCFFARVTVGLPFLFVPFLTIPLKLQGLFMVGLFFACDLSGSIEQFGARGDFVNHWAHVGGYLAGLGLGFLMRLHLPAAEEAERLRAGRIAAAEVDTAESTRIYRRILEDNPDDVTALSYMLTHLRFNPTEAEAYFVRLVTVLCASDFKRAAQLVTEHYPAHLQALPGRVLFRLGAHFRRAAQFDKARFCLEFAHEKEGPWQAKALLCLGEAFVGLGNDDRARSTFEEVSQRYPGSDFAHQARSAIDQLG
jgi:membrane associated rhomboid family serine protease